MQFILAIVGLMAAIGVILYRMGRAAEHAKDAAEAVRDVGLMARRWGWRGKFAKDPLQFVTDPREATVTMMAALAQADGAMTERERSVILEHTQRVIGTNAQLAAELLAHARWVVRDVRDTTRCLVRLAPVVQKACTREQIADVLEMLDAVAHADGAPRAPELDAIARLRSLIA
jgi:uncharacterized tellurite resistance protein B-like protein